MGLPFLTAMAVSFSFGAWAGAGMVLLLLPFALFFQGETRRALALGMAAAAAAGLVFQLHLVFRHEPVARLGGQTLLFQGTVLEREEKGRAEQYEIKGRFPQVSGVGEVTIQVNCFSGWDLQPGEEVAARLKLTAFTWDTGWEQNYIAKGICLGGEPAGEVERLPVSSHPVEGRFARYRAQLRRRILQEVGGQEGALCAGMALGGASLLSRENRSAMRAAGLSHLLAVSGFHLVVLTSLLRLALSRVKKRWKIPLLLAFVWGYALLLGFPASILRAVIVFTLALLAEAADRRADSLNSIGFAALAVGLLAPFSAGGLSVQMTFLSSLGIVLFSGPVCRFLEGRVLFFLGPRLPRMRWAVEAFSFSLCAGFALSPLMAVRFGTLPLYGPLAAVFTAFLAPLALGGTLLLLLLPPLAGWIAPVVRLFAAGILGLARWISTLPGAVLPVGDGAVPLVLAAAVVLLGILTLREARESTVRLAISGLSALLFAVLAAEQLLAFGAVAQVGMEGWNGALYLRRGRAVMVGSPGSLSSGERLCDLLDRHGVEGIDLLILPRKTEGAGLDRLQEEHPIACFVATGSNDYREGLSQYGMVLPYGPMEIEVLGAAKVSIREDGEIFLTTDEKGG